MCENSKCNCSKQTSFTPKQFQLEENGYKKTMKNIFEGSQTAWNEFLKPPVNVAAPFSGMAVSAKTKNPKVGAATTNILKSISSGKILSLIDGLRLKDM